MANTFKQDLSESTKMYSSYVAPVINRLIKGYMITVEGRTEDELAHLLDTSAGIDLFNIRPEGIAGVASRIQKGRNWRTFTVRFRRDSGAKTEYEKRVYAIKNGLLYPLFTFQAYVDDNRLAGMAVVRTVDLMEYIKDERPILRHTGDDKIGGASFYAVEWDKLRRCGYKVAEYDACRDKVLF